MKKLFLAIITIIIVASLVLGGCAESTPAPTTPAAPATPTTPTTPEPEPIVIKFANAEPPPSVLNQNHTWWMEQVEKLTDGRVKCEAYLAGALGKVNELAENCEQGIADVVFTSAAYNPGRYPIGDLIFQLVTPNAPYDIWHNKMMHDRILEAGLRDQDFERVKFCYIFPMQSHQLFLNKRVTTMEELKGLRIRTSGVNEPLAAMGMDPVALPYGEMEMALERGILDGVLTSNGPVFLFGAGPYVQYCIYDPFICGGGSWVMMNKDTWNSLPPDIQEIIDDLNYAASYHAAELMARANQDFYLGLKNKYGVEFYHLDPAELERWEDELAHCAPEYAEELEAKGVPAKEALKQIIEIVELTKN